MKQEAETRRILNWGRPVSRFLGFAMNAAHSIGKCMHYLIGLVSADVETHQLQNFIECFIRSTLLGSGRSSAE